MRESWQEFYDLNGDPFSTAALATEGDFTFFYRTGDIQSEIDPWVGDVAKGQSKITFLIGARGYGKTSTLRYIERRLQETSSIPLFVRVEEDPNKNPTPEHVATQLVERAIHAFVTQIVQSSELYTETISQLLGKIEKKMGFEILDGTVFDIGERDYDLGWASNFLQQLVGYYSNRGSPVVLLVDNLDKWLLAKNRDLLMDFLEGPMAQSFFEGFTSNGGAVCITGTPQLAEMIRARQGDQSQISYLTDRIQLTDMKPREAYQLLRHRFTQMGPLERFPFSETSVLRISHRSEGILRVLIFEAKRALVAGATLGLETIGEEEVNRVLSSPEFPELHRELVRESKQFRESCRELLKVVGRGDGAREKEALEDVKVLFGILAREAPLEDLSEPRQERLTADGVLSVKNGTPELSDEAFAYLVDTLVESNINPHDWVEWYLAAFVELEMFGTAGSVVSQKVGRVITLLERSDRLHQIDIQTESGVVAHPAHKVKSYALERLRRNKRFWDEFDRGFQDMDEADAIEEVNSHLFWLAEAFNNIYCSLNGVSYLRVNRTPLQDMVAFAREDDCVWRRLLQDLDADFEEFYQLWRLVVKDGTKKLTSVELAQWKEHAAEITERVSDAATELLKQPLEDPVEYVKRGKTGVLELIRRFSQLSTSKVIVLWPSGEARSAGYLLVWREAENWFGVISGTGEFADGLRRIMPEVKTTDIVQNARLGTVALDTSVLLGGTLRPYGNWGFVEWMDLVLAPAVEADREYSITKKVPERVEARLRQLRDDPESVLGVSAAPLRREVPEEWRDAVESKHPSHRAEEIDKLTCAWAAESGIKLAIGDRDVARILEPDQPVLLAMPNGDPQLTRFESLDEVFDKMMSLSADDACVEFWEIDGPPLASGLIRLRSWALSLNVYEGGL